MFLGKQYIVKGHEHKRDNRSEYMNVNKQLNKIKTSHYTYTMGLVAVILLFSFIVSGYWPFGSNTIAKIDLSSQYLDLYNYFKHVIQGQEGLFYSFNKGIGGDMFSIWTYYLMSPFNLVYALFSESNVLNGVQIVYSLKLLAMTWTATNYLKQKGMPIQITVLGVLGWVFSGYLLLYRIHLMWMDAFILIPLVTLAIEKGFKTGNYWGLTLWLTLAIYSQYYIGYMVGIYTVIYMVYLYITKDKDETGHVFQYVKHCIYSGLLSVWILIPTAYKSLGSLREQDPMNFINSFNIGEIFLKLRWAHLGIDDYVRSAPLLMMGTVLLVLLIHTLMNTTKRQRVGFLVVTIIYMASFYITPLNRIWHLGQEETWYTIRYAFTYLWFILAFLGHNKEFVYINKGIKQKLVTVFILITTNGFILMYDDLPPIMLAVIFTFIITLITSIVLFFPSKHIQPLLTMIGVIEIVMLVVYMTLFGAGLTVTEYQDSYTNVDNALEQVSETEQTVRYYNTDDKRMLNEGLTHNQSFISHTSSSQSSYTRELYKLLRVDQGYSLVGKEGMTLIPQALLNVKYIIGDVTKLERLAEDTSVYTQLTDTLYQNDTRLGLGYTINEPMTSDTTNLSEVLTQLLGGNYIQEKDINDFTYHNLEIDTDKQTYKVVDESQDAYLEYTIPDDVNYMEFKNNYDNMDEKDFKEAHFVTNLTWYYQAIPSTKDTFKIMVYTPETPIKSTEYKLPKFYAINETQFSVDIQNYFNNHSPIEDLEMTAGRVQGTVNNMYADSYLQLAIPYEEGWEAKVNGEDVTITNSMNLMAIPIPEGESTIQLAYQTPYFTLSLLFSGLCFVVMILEYELKRLKK